MAGAVRATLPEPFAIGLRPIEEPDWLRVDGRRQDYIAEKRRLSAEKPDEVFAQVPGSESGQAEALETIEAWLRANAPVALADMPKENPPLMSAGLALCEDLALMRRTDEGWTLAAGSIHFPSVWRLSEKIGRPMHAIHAPVPGYEAGTRGDGMIERIFDALAPGTIVERGNWSLHVDEALHLPRNPSGHEVALARMAPGEVTARRERQTLRKLPRTGDILFTIDVSVAPLSSLDAAEREALSRQLRALDAPQRSYKGLDLAADPIADAFGTG